MGMRIADAGLSESGVLMPADRKRVSIGDATVVFKALGGDTGSDWSLMEYTAPPRFAGPPPHFHQQMSEAFYILDGVITLMLGEQVVEAQPGTFVLIPPGTIHTFSNAEDTPARILGFVSPAGYEHYFEDLAALADAEDHWPPSNPHCRWRSVIGMTFTCRWPSNEDKANESRFVT